MSARETILDAVRSGLGNTAVDPAAVRRDADALLQDLPSIRPALLADGLVDAFIARVTSPKVAATAECIASASELPAALCPSCSTTSVGRSAQAASSSSRVGSRRSARSSSCNCKPTSHSPSGSVAPRSRSTRCISAMLRT